MRFDRLFGLIIIPLVIFKDQTNIRHSYNIWINSAIINKLTITCIFSLVREGTLSSCKALLHHWFIGHHFAVYPPHMGIVCPMNGHFHSNSLNENIDDICYISSHFGICTCALVYYELKWWTNYNWIPSINQLLNPSPLSHALNLQRVSQSKNRKGGGRGSEKGQICILSFMDDPWMMNLMGMRMSWMAKTPYDPIRPSPWWFPSFSRALKRSELNKYFQR